jgi:asparagine synthase (glutamine-hydrolysing)
MDGERPNLYATDAEYEEHFLSLFRRSVARRIGPGAPILAQLSGGMDSSSIVCMSDRIREEHGAAPDNLLDTISYFDESEPNWDEQPYFSVVEARRRKIGIHLSISAPHRTFAPPGLQVGMTARLPGIDRYAIERERQFEAAVADRQYRVILSGIGGDELLGGVPTPLPELADYLISCRPHKLISKALEFCLIDRTPLLYMLGETASYSVRTCIPSRVNSAHIPPWVSCRHKHISDLLRGDLSSQVPWFDFAPSRIENGHTWWQMLETLPHLYPSALSHYEYRYPYLDRDLVDFLHRIPREQLVRPGRRRSLMRRALADIVPAEVLERPRKASLIRGPIVSLQRCQVTIRTLFEASIVGALGLVDEKCFKEALDIISKGTTPKWWPAVIKAINLEFWLQGQREILNGIPARVT